MKVCGRVWCLELSSFLSWNQRSLFLWILVFTILSCSQNSRATFFYVNDWARVLTSDQIENLEYELKSIEDSVGSQVVVLIINSLEGEAIEKYSLDMAENWKIGRKDFNDGILITVSIFDQEMRIEVGLGLEKIIRDEIAAKIIRENMIPDFKEEKYYEGLLAGINQINSLILQNKELIGQPY